MLLTITTTRRPATDLSFMLHKHPAKVQSVEIRNGLAHIFYPEATEERCTCAMVMDIDPVGLVRNNRGPAGDAFALEQYVNDRPYVASSFLSTAIAKAFGTALNGKCSDKPELVDELMPLEVKLAVLPVRGGPDVLDKMFLPLGYSISAIQHPLDTQFPDWGFSRYFTVILKHTIKLKDLLSHLFILIPVLDNDKHYWVDKEEIGKLMEKGKGWLELHPERELIIRRYLKHQNRLAADAMAMLMKDETAATMPQEEEAHEESKPKIRLHDFRLHTVLNELVQSGAQSVMDLGCGDGKLLTLLMEKRQFTRILGMDVSLRSLEIASEKLKLQRMPDKQRQRVELVQGALTYFDHRLKGYDAAALVEVIEHLDEDRLYAMERMVFSLAAPETVVVTTPNKDWNVMFTEDSQAMRHADHRFEWTREQFAGWCSRIGDIYSYRFRIEALGEVAAAAGAPSQMAVFTKQLKS
ncbi:MAG: 3' terminal RNA ribose 2'-O-methyltransferase Hen1 [Sphingobacteriales bacterium]|nr:MAG: 3' terminal RNA ribose 2'-O-methyltransferase Hen1 [Sphingobacteriales bacterium]